MAKTNNPSTEQAQNQQNNLNVVPQAPRIAPITPAWGMDQLPVLDLNNHGDAQANGHEENEINRFSPKGTKKLRRI